ncbi:hypothetical protein LOK49_LG07G03177 [Camellia lanceoleosa]|uniref:Uncharacterized protein n=1 Tax=Camellia lanceoleosa TaxID=1840588 RepID=A0ACC0GXJ7_9ERIC|nr:hypothetical protein LOK49_LG07G03177 [Camellia lanceoleosa]
MKEQEPGVRLEETISNIKGQSLEAEETNPLFDPKPTGLHQVSDSQLPLEHTLPPQVTICKAISELVDRTFLGPHLGHILPKHSDHNHALESDPITEGDIPSSVLPLLASSDSPFSISELRLSSFGPSNISQELQLIYIPLTMDEPSTPPIDMCVLSAYGQIDNFFDFLHSNLCNISRQSKLSDEVNEVVSSLVFAASRCGELPELRRMRTLFKQHFGDEFERNNVELQLGNSLNSHMKHNLGKNSVPDDMKLQLTSNIAREYTLSLEPPTHEQNTLCHNASRFSSTNSKSLVTFPCDSYDSSSNRTTLDSSPPIQDTLDSSPPIQDTAIVYLDDMENQLSNKEDFRGKNEINGLDSWDRNVRSKSFVKKSLAQRHNALIKKDEACIKYNGLLRENRVNYQNMIVKGDISMHNSCNSRHDHQGEIEEDEESKPRLSYVHPKLPDYDELVATFTVQERVCEEQFK